jgi:hypothetical protein
MRASDLSRRETLAAGVAFAAAPAAAAPSSVHGFDFLMGRWRVRHRKLRRRLAGSTEWFEFPGTLDVRPILGGVGNVDENVLDDPAGRYLATSLRLFDARTGDWSVWWLDGRAPALEAPVTGRFTDRRIALFANETFEGRPIRVRATYEDQGDGRAEWTQAFSADGGATWEVNWIMAFSRA